ncbi:MAG: hypothetical protein H6760_04985 [Candidatus Nomurabacteria bacterium]|nr:MAG: hypothetical protein H6760_04985 [Candidatus Nomurabacteria bacterium]
MDSKEIERMRELLALGDRRELTMPEVIELQELRRQVGELSPGTIPEAMFPQGPPRESGDDESIGLIA